MEFGLQFFPDIGPEEKSAQRYWNECLDLAGLCDELGYTHVRTVEHYFEPYGGYFGSRRGGGHAHLRPGRHSFLLIPHISLLIYK